MDIDPRVLYAAERTLLAWIRTGLAMMGFGFIAARFSLFMRELTQAKSELPPTPGLSLFIGTSLVALGVAVTLFAALRHRRDVRKLSLGQPLIKPGSVSAGEIIGFILGMIGATMVAYLIRLGM